jgi:putative peptide maturation dehydrogenase
MVFVELEQEPRFDFGQLLVGGDGLDRSVRWLAHAPHLRLPVLVTLAQLAVLQAVDADQGEDMDRLVERHGLDVIRELLDAGLLVTETSLDGRGHACDAAARRVPWWPPALLAQSGGGWTGIDIEARHEAGLMPSAAQLVVTNGPAPAPGYERRPGQAVQRLRPPARRDFDGLLAQRRTCRNFDEHAALSAQDLATMLHRVWGAIGTRELAPGAVAVKKTSPAGGGLHAVEAYVLVQRAEGLAPGLYHYLPLEHALEPMQAMQDDAAAALAHRFLAGQYWFANVPVLVVMTARFDRLFWKYRRHAKAWRVAHLDVGHLSQTMYLSAADLGLGAFVTAAINDLDIEAALELAPLQEAALAIVGFGPRSERSTTIELDQLVPTPAALQTGD